MKVYNDFDLTTYNSYRIKATCRRAIFPESEEDIQEIFQCNRIDDIILLGSGHNIILSQKYYNKDFVIFSGTFDKVTVNMDYIEAESGATMLELSELALKHSLSGLEVFYDIPSSLGGAVVMNAGASGEEIKNLISTVRYFDTTTRVFYNLLPEESNFEYRNSFFQKNTHLIVTQVILKLNFAEREGIQKKMHDVKDARWAKQPKEFPNAGSVFKRPKGKYVGPMIEELGLKGFAIGGAMVSEKHAGFIINYNNATGKDILDLIADIKAKVFLKYGVDLEVEQRII